MAVAVLGVGVTSFNLVPSLVGESRLVLLVGGPAPACEGRQPLGHAIAALKRMIARRAAVIGFWQDGFRDRELAELVAALSSVERGFTRGHLIHEGLQELQGLMYAGWVYSFEDAMEMATAMEELNVPIGYGSAGVPVTYTLRYSRLRQGGRRGSTEELMVREVVLLLVNAGEDDLGLRVPYALATNPSLSKLILVALKLMDLSMVKNTLRYLACAPRGDEELEDLVRKLRPMYIRRVVKPSANILERTLRERGPEYLAARLSKLLDLDEDKVEEAVEACAGGKKPIGCIIRRVMSRGQAQHGV